MSEVVDETTLSRNATFFEGRFAFTPLDGTTQIDFCVAISTDNGQTWFPRMHGTMQGDHVPIVRPSAAIHPISYGFINEYAGSAIKIRTTVVTSKPTGIVITRR